MDYQPLLVFFFFQAEDGIRDKLVTGVQTCALPICSSKTARRGGHLFGRAERHRHRKRTWPRSRPAVRPRSATPRASPTSKTWPGRSEERRVGKSVDLGGRRIIKKKKKKKKEGSIEG